MYKHLGVTSTDIIMVYVNELQDMQRENIVIDILACVGLQVPRLVMLLKTDYTKF